jgi:natural product precursor
LKTNNDKKLLLNKKIIARLEERELKNVKGGGFPFVGYNPSPTDDCP